MASVHTRSQVRQSHPMRTAPGLYGSHDVCLPSVW
jgi:hypothetical protein